MIGQGYCGNTCSWSDEVDRSASPAIYRLLLFKGTSTDAHSEAVLYQRKERGESDDIGATSNNIHFLGVIDSTKYQPSHNLQ